MDSRVLLCVLSVVSLSYGAQYEGKHQRPQYSRDTSSVHQQQTTRTAEGQTNLMKIAVQYIRDNPDILPSIANMMSQLDASMILGPDDDKPQSQSTFQCPQYGSFPCEVASTTASSLDKSDDIDLSMAERWSYMSEKILEDSEECTNCVEIWTALKTLACAGLPYETIRDIIIEWCSNNLGLEPFVCNGTITIQGEHVYCIVMQADPRKLCESLNNCFPTDDRVDRLPVNERTPWAVKATMEAEGKWPAVQKSHTKRRKRTPEGDKYIKIAVLADIHVQTQHSVGSATECDSVVCCLEDIPGEGSARYWGEYTCNLPLHTTQLFMERVRGIQPDFLLYAGDSPPHTQYDETEDSQLNCSQIIVDTMIKSFGSNLRVYPAIGNHEMFPTNLYSTRIGETTRMLDGFTKIWHNIAGFDTVNNGTFSSMSYYSILERPGLRVVVINTELDWYTANFYATLNEHTPENDQHKQWVNDTLTAAKNNNEKVIIVSHHPVGGADSNVRSSRWWEEIAVQFGDIIVLHVSGHTHIDDMKILFDPLTMEPKYVNHVAPTTNTKSYVNPSLMVYYLDPTNFTLMTYESFHLDLDDQEQSIGVPPVIQFGYEARMEYDLVDLSPQSYKELILRFTEDEALFKKYYLNRQSLSTLEYYCDYSCRMQTICHMWFADYAEAKECILHIPPIIVPPINPTDPVNGATALGSCLIFLLSFVIITRSLYY